ncbi:BLUF domain-containing protein [Curtobacterium aetherium]|nr:BLUF domain-containing protein [Curtobacterium sp. L6-1]
MLQSLVYMSSATQPFDAEALEEVLEYSRVRNTQDGLTGLLVHRAGRFMQLLEGPHDAVMATYSRIVGDPRHDEVRLLVEESIHTRRFPDWTMAFDRGDQVEPPEGFSDFLGGGDASADRSKPRELLRWFRNHPMAAPTASLGKHRRD